MVAWPLLLFSFLLRHSPMIENELYKWLAIGAATSKLHGNLFEPEFSGILFAGGKQCNLLHSLLLLASFCACIIMPILLLP
jgi:hypothetical protein